MEVIDTNLIRFTISGILVLGIFTVQIKHHYLNPQTLKKILIATFGALVALVTYEGFALYGFWQSSQLSQFFLPPYQDYSYFIWTLFRKSFAPWLIAAIGAFILAKSAYWLNKKYDERFFESEEIPLFALGAFLSGYPGIIFYLLLMILSELLLAIVYTVLGWGRAPMYYLWLPGALFVIIVMYLLPAHLLGLFYF